MPAPKSIKHLPEDKQREIRMKRLHDANKKSPIRSKMVMPAADYEKLTPEQKKERKLEQARRSKKRRRQNSKIKEEENKKRRVGKNGTITNKKVETRKKTGKTLYDQKAQLIAQINEQLAKIDHDFFKNCLEKIKTFNIKPWNHECFGDDIRYAKQKAFYVKKEKAIKKSLSALKDLIYQLTEFNTQSSTEKTENNLCHKFASLSGIAYPKGGAAVAVKRKMTETEVNPTAIASEPKKAKKGSVYNDLNFSVVCTKTKGSKKKKPTIKMRKPLSDDKDHYNERSKTKTDNKYVELKLPALPPISTLKMPSFSKIKVKPFLAPPPTCILDETSINNLADQYLDETTDDCQTWCEKNGGNITYKCENELLDETMQKLKEFSEQDHIAVRPGFATLLQEELENQSSSS